MGENVSDIQSEFTIRVFTCTTKYFQTPITITNSVSNKRKAFLFKLAANSFNMTVFKNKN